MLHSKRPWIPATASTSINPRSAPANVEEKYSAAPAPAAKKILPIEMLLGEACHFTSSWASRLAHAASRVFNGLLAVSVSIK
jgi:hypothetical protein